MYNDKKIKANRRELRKNLTDAERLIWKCIRNKQIGGLKFFRQYSVGLFVLDLYCPQIRIAIEVDGGQHAEETKRHDDERTNFLNKQNIRVIRFWNNEVLSNIEGVVGRIVEEVNNNSPQPSLTLREGVSKSASRGRN